MTQPIDPTAASESVEGRGTDNCGGSAFDVYASSYEDALARGLSITGESSAYFAEGRVAWLAHRLHELAVQPRRVLDFGCGTGKSTIWFLRLLRAESVVGIDNSSASLMVARNTNSQTTVRFLLPEEYSPSGEVDLAFTNGVFHHIPPGKRERAASYIFRALRPGGLFAFWENNPWNPGARYVMSRIPFDRDALTVWPSRARMLLRVSGFEILRTDFLFVFPRILRGFRWLEPYLARWPFGAQYQVLSQKPFTAG